MQGSLWGWDAMIDPQELLLAGETFTEKIYWPREMGIHFFSFPITTRYPTLVHYYKTQQEE